MTNATTAAAPKRPVVEGLFVETERGPKLVGSMCACGAGYFPRAATCNNPRCSGRATTEYLFGPRGIVWSYTVMHYPPPPPARAEVPYAVALVELPEGLRVLGQIHPDDLQRVKVGAEVELSINKLYADEHGRNVVTWMFRVTGDRC